GGKAEVGKPGGTALVGREESKHGRGESRKHEPEQTAPGAGSSAHVQTVVARGRELRQPLRQFRHDPPPLLRRESDPAADLGKGTAAADAQPRGRIDHAGLDAWSLDISHGAPRCEAAEDKPRAREGNCRHRQGGAHVPILNRCLRQSNFCACGSLGIASGCGCGCVGGESSVIGASADITRSGGNVTMTSVPMRNFDLRVKVPPCISMRFFAIGKPRPAPCSADLIEFEPWPNDASTIGISSSGMPGPVSLTLRYCPPDAVHPTLSQISPPCGVNLMALPRRL